MRLRRLASFLAVLLASLVSLGSCGGSPAEPEDALIWEFAIRSDTPYMRGVIVERMNGRGGAPRIRVEARPGVLARAPEAIATVLPDAVIRWADGDHGTLDDLRVGTVVTVWVTGPELRSFPPQVSANGILLHGPWWRR